MISGSFIFQYGSCWVGITLVHCDCKMFGQKETQQTLTCRSTKKIQKYFLSRTTLQFSRFSQRNFHSIIVFSTTHFFQLKAIILFGCKNTNSTCLFQFLCQRRVSYSQKSAKTNRSKKLSREQLKQEVLWTYFNYNVLEGETSDFDESQKWVFDEPTDTSGLEVEKIMDGVQYTRKSLLINFIGI